MRENKIQQVKPFNAFLLRSCYYHQLVAALSCFGIGADSVLLNMFTCMHEDFGHEEQNILPEKELCRKLNCRIKRCRLGKHMLCKNIDAGNPIIVGVDCFYLENRAQTYRQRHDPHYILVYGYNLDTDTVNVVDHDYINDNKYREQVISLSNLLLCEKKFRRIHDRWATCRVVSKRNPAASLECLRLWQYIPQENVQNSRLASQSNLLTLRKMMGGDADLFRQKTKKAVSYITGMIRFYNVLMYARCFQSEELTACIGKLLGAYTLLRSVLWKAEARDAYVLPPEQCEKVLRKIDEIDMLEEKIYAVLTGACA